ncbi:MAG: hypothetical protein SXQ77_04395, partial [Halobacteria archaeon]|nr:hypothetical protein [Halobacteria archaeon]
TALAPAIPRDSVAKGGQYYDGIANNVEEYHNYWSANDGILRGLYQPREGGTEALGRYGIEGEPAPNYYDHDVTNKIEGHCEHIYKENGTGDEAARDVWIPLGNGANEPSGGSGGGGLFGNLFG